MSSEQAVYKPERSPTGQLLPGQSGNPGGRPAGLGAMIREKTKNGEELVDFMLDVLRGLKEKKQKDRLEACNWLADRGFGKVVQDLSLQGPDGGPVQTESLHIIASMSKEELLALAAPRLNGDIERDLDHNSEPSDIKDVPPVAPQDLSTLSPKGTINLPSEGDLETHPGP